MFLTLQKTAPVTLLSSDTRLPGLDSLTLEDFWAWAYSNLLTNTVRPIYAEFLVTAALGNINTPREEWADVDLRYETGERALTAEMNYIIKINSYLIFEILNYVLSPFIIYTMLIYLTYFI